MTAAVVSHVLLIRISLTANDVDHFSVCLFAIYICISGELSQLFCTYKIIEFFFFLLNFEGFFFFLKSAEYKLLITYGIENISPSL